ncbi:MAG: hypothetical protein ACI8RN_002124 [Glaciecola sp.]|jgi:hypothetical protein
MGKSRQRPEENTGSSRVLQISCVIRIAAAREIVRLRALAWDIV